MRKAIKNKSPVTITPTTKGKISGENTQNQLKLIILNTFNIKSITVVINNEFIVIDFI